MAKKQNSSKRQAVVAVMVGGRGTGKTVKARRIIDNYPGHRRKLVLDTEDHPKYRDFGTIKANQIPGWKPINGKFRPKRIYEGLPIDNIKTVQQHYRNGILVFEDARKYIGKHPDPTIEQFIIDSKQKGVDLLFIYHSFRAVPQMIWDYTDLLTVLKTKKGITRDQKNRVPDFEEIAEADAAVRASSDPYDSKTLEIA